MVTEKKLPKKTPAKKKPEKKKPEKKKPAEQAEPQSSEQAVDTRSQALKEADRAFEEAIAPKEEPEEKPERRIAQSGTTEATIVVCQCGKTGFEIVRQTTTAVSLKCSACGHEMSVKGPVAITHVTELEVQAAIKESIVRPDPAYQSSAKKKEKTPEQEAEAGKYTMLRFRVLVTAKQSVIDRAMESVRLENASDDIYKQQTWQGHALEYICADYLSGANPEILAHIDQIEDEIDALIKKEKDEGTAEASLTRKVRDARQRLREKSAAEIGIIAPAKKEPPKKIEPVKDDDERIKDDERLLGVVRDALIEAAESYRDESGKTLGLLIDVLITEATNRANKDGGFVVEVRGDVRTRSKVGRRPTVVFWMEKEVPQVSDLDLLDWYRKEYELDLPMAELEIVEITPNNPTWQMPTFCTSREER